ncbi:MAG: hypothetical protein CL609_05845 [Anaerolineaceae bacterium]|nr:hypothetical protein [Anaerolineaceae bacterium]
MKKLSFVILLLAAVLLLNACTSAVPTVAEELVAPTEAIEEITSEPLVPTDTPEPTLEPEDLEPVITLVGMDGEKSFTMSELKNMEIVEGQAGIKSSTGQIYPPALYKGVSLKTLLAEMGDIDESMGVNIVAEDGYGLSFSYDQIMNGNFIAYDPATGDELRNPVALDAILAFERDGEELDKREDGTLRVVIISEKNNQVTDGHWSIKWVDRIEVNSLVQDWALVLTGAITETIDRSGFESCVNCHEASWEDDKGQVWKGTPLWRLMGYADDAIKHEGLCYVDELAEAGYAIELVASDGYSVELSSIDANRNENWVVANTVDGNPLPEKYFPLRLVGEGLEKSSLVGALTNINFDLEPISAEDMVDPDTLQVVDVDTGDLVVVGLVSQEVGLTQDALRAWHSAMFTVEHPKKGEVEYEGVLLNELLDFIGVADGATTLVMTADDGYSIEVALEDVRTCADCLITFDEEGSFASVMPGMETSTWVKGLVRLEIK